MSHRSGGLGYFREALEVNIEDYFPIGEYEVSVEVGDLLVEGGIITIAYPSPTKVE